MASHELRNPPGSRPGEKRTQSANQAPRCQHQKLNGSSCAAPALRGRKFCRFHDAALANKKDYSLPMVEDATSLQFAIMQVLRGLADHALDTKTAALMLYGLQIACMNLKRLHAERPQQASNEEQSLAEILLRRLDLQSIPQDAQTAIIEAVQAAAGRNLTANGKLLTGITPG
jgi:hypothetical protein